MKKKTAIIIGIIIVVILLVPIPLHLKDGGTVEYKSLIYKISKVHKLELDSQSGYKEWITIEILGFEIYNNVK